MQALYSNENGDKMRKPIKSPLYFDARFHVLGKVIQSSMCPHCEEEGEIYLRIASNPSEPMRYDPKEPSTFIDVIGFDPKAAYLKVKPGDWIEADVVCSGYMKKIRASGIEIEGNILASGNRKIGRVALKEGQLTVDFKLFKAILAAQSSEEMAKALKRQRIHDGVYVETDCSVDLVVKTIRQQASSGLERIRGRRR